MENSFVKNRKKGQASIETALAFIAMVLLLGGITNIWLWANTQMVKRQVAYNEGRVNAGQAITGYTLCWPTPAPAQLKEGKVLLDRR